MYKKIFQMREFRYNAYQMLSLYVFFCDTKYLSEKLDYRILQGQIV